jgi:hypothetical protein
MSFSAPFGTFFVMAAPAEQSIGEILLCDPQTLRFDLEIVTQNSILGETKSSVCILSEKTWQKRWEID